MLTVFDFHVRATAVQQPMQSRPGRTFVGPAFVPDDCPPRSPVTGDLISPACMDENSIRAHQYGLRRAPDGVIGRRQCRRYDWARVGNDAVLAYGSLWWCRVVAVADGHFEGDPVLAPGAR